MALQIGLKDGKPVAYDPSDPLSSFGVVPAQQSSVPVSTPSGSFMQNQIVPKEESKPTEADLEAREIQRIKEAGGGYMASGSGIMKISGSKQEQMHQKEAINVKVKGTNTILTLPISAGVSKKVAEAGGYDAIFNQTNQLRSQEEIRIKGRDVIYKAAQLAASGKDLTKEEMQTPEEALAAQQRSIIAYNFAFKQAQKPFENFADFMLYGFYDPFGIKTSLEASRIRSLGGTKQQALEAAWRSGRFSYEYQKATDQMGFVATSSIGAGSLAMIGVAPVLIKYPVVRIGLGTASIFSAEYQLTKEMIEGKASFPSAMIQLTTIGLAAAGIYSGFVELEQRRLVDPLLKDVDVKEYQKIPAKKYIAKYGEESKIAESNMERLKLREFEQRDILGKPTDQMPQVKDYDKAIRLTFRHQEKGGAVVKTITFKQTEEGWKPVGRIELDRYFPDQKKLFRILDQWGSDQNIDISRGFVEKFIIEPTNKIKMFDWNSNIMKNIVKVEWVGVEKPETFAPLIKEASVKSSGINWDVYRELAPEVQQQISKTLLFGSKSDIEALGIKDLTRTPSGIDIDIKTGAIESHAANLALKLQPEIIDSLKIENPVPVDVITINRVPDIVVNPDKAPMNFQTPIIILGSLNQQGSHSLRLLKPDLDLKEDQTPINIIKINQDLGSNLNQRMKQNIIPSQIISPVQAAANMQKLDVDIVNIQDQINLQIQPEIQQPRVPERFRRETFDIDIPMENLVKDLQSRGFAIEHEPKDIQAIKLALPTASFYSLEKAAAEFGSASLARGSEIEKIFRQRTEAFGLAEEFPAAEFIKKPKKKKRRNYVKIRL